MLEQKLFTVGKSCFYLVQANEAGFQNLYLHLTHHNPKAVIKTIRFALTPWMRCERKK
jgi:hypothetical protein